MRSAMSFEIFTSFLMIAAPFGAALLWARYTASPGLSVWLRKSVFYGAPAFAVLVAIIKTITLACTHQANFGFTSCTTIPVSVANLSMTAFVFALMLCAGYGLALFGVGVAVELQTRFGAKR